MVVMLRFILLGQYLQQEIFLFLKQKRQKCHNRQKCQNRANCPEKRELMEVNFEKLKPVQLGSSTKRTFVITGKDLTEKQEKAGYYISVKKGGKLDGYFAGFSTDATYNTEEVKLSDADGNEIILKSCAALKNRLSTIEIGSPVRLIYNGKEIIKKGPRKGKEAHSWEVLA